MWHVRGPDPADPFHLDLVEPALRAGLGPEDGLAMVPRPGMGVVLPQEEHIESTWPRGELAGANQLPHQIQDVIGGSTILDGLLEVAAAQAGPDLDTRRRRQVEVRADLDRFE